MTALVPFSEAQQMAQYLSKSSLLPPDLKGKEADICFAILTGAEIGLGPMAAIRGIHIIKGKPCLAAATMVGSVLRAGLAEYFSLIESTDKVATYETRRKGAPVPTRMSWTIEQAKAAGLLGSNQWKAHPDAMLRARCSSALARTVYPDVVGGFYDPDEMAETTRGQPESGIIEAEYIDVQSAPTAAPEPRHATEPESPAAQPIPEPDDTLAKFARLEGMIADLLRVPVSDPDALQTAWDRLNNKLAGSVAKAVKLESVPRERRDDLQNAVKRASKHLLSSMEALEKQGAAA